MPLYTVKKTLETLEYYPSAYTGRGFKASRYAIIYCNLPVNLLEY